MSRSRYEIMKYYQLHYGLRIQRRTCEEYLHTL